MTKNELVALIKEEIKLVREREKNAAILYNGFKGAEAGLINANAEINGELIAYHKVLKMLKTK